MMRTAALGLLLLSCNGLVSEELADSGTAVVSTDGGTDAAIENVAYAAIDALDAGPVDPPDASVAGRMVFVITGQDMRHLVSFDGLTWEHDEYIAPNGLDNAFTGVAIGNHAIVISGDPGIYRSTDGITYTLVVPKTAQYGFHSSQCTFANGQFVIVAGAYSWRSRDGITWESNKQTEGNSGHWHSLIFGNGHWLALGDQVRKISEDGLLWHDIVPFAKDTFADVAFGGGRFLAVGKVALDGGTAAGWVATSTDALTWAEKPSVATVYNTGFSTVAFGDGFFVTRRAGDVIKSVDGEAWSKFTSPASPGSSLYFANGRFASAGWRTEASLYSPDAGRFVSTYSGTHPNKYDDAGIEPWFTGFAMGEL